MKYTLKIVEPCSENWNEMTPNERGRYCAHCEKTVIDFSEMSDLEVANYLHLHQKEEICGHIRISQNEKSYIFIESRISVSPVKSYIMAFLAGLMVTNPLLADASQKEKYPIEQIEHTDFLQEINQNPQPPAKKVISGYLVQEGTGKPITNAKIVFDFAETIPFLTAKMEYIQKLIKKAQAQRTPNTADILQKQNRIKEIKRDIFLIKKIMAEKSFSTITDKKGKFTFSLPENLPKVQITLHITPENADKKQIEPILLGYDEKIVEKEMKVKILDKEIYYRGMTGRAAPVCLPTQKK